MQSKTCFYCGVAFVPNKYSRRQRVCSSPECQKKRQLESMRQWRENHPNYFKYDESKGLEWLETQRRRAKVWREKNSDKLRAYRQAHSQAYRDYMRDYMRRYREKRKTAEPGPKRDEGNPPI